MNLRQDVRKLVFGVGINDADYNVVVTEKVDGKWKQKWKCKAYSKWTNMLMRCYDTKYIQGRPTYTGCEVCEEWKTFSNFKAWIEIHDSWEDKQLDKDLLIEGNKIYSPETCCLVTSPVNNLLEIHKSRRGKYPLGVSTVPNSDRFRARCGKVHRVSYHKTPEEAHRAYQIAKRNQAIYLQSQQTCERTKQGLQRIIDKLQHHIDNNIETKDL